MRVAAARFFSSPDARGLLGIAAFIIVFFAPVWARGYLFLSDGQYTAFFAPIQPWSNAWIGGWPAGADTAAYVWYPLRIAMLWAHLGFNAFVIAAYVVAAVGTYTYLRLVSASPLASAIGGLGFAFSGFMIGHLSHTSMIHASAWIPWMFAGVEGCLTRQQRRWGAVVALSVATSLLAGHTQLTFYGLVALGSYLVWRLGYCWTRRRMRSWLLACAGVAVGLLIAAPQLLMTLDYIDETPRAALSYEAFISYSLPIAQLPTILFPYLFGSATGIGPLYFGTGNFPETCLYVPFLSFALAVPGFLFRRDIAIFWASLAVVSLLLALGGGVPPLAELMYKLPGFNLFRAPARHVMEFCLAMSMLSALGTQALLDGPSMRVVLRCAALTTMAAALAACVSVGCLAIAALYAERARTVLAPWLSNPGIGFGLFGILAGLAAFTALALRERSLRPAFVVGALIGMSSFAWYAAWRGTARPPWMMEPGAVESQVAARLRTEGGRFLYTQWLWTSGIAAERPRMFAMPSVNWYGPLLPMLAGDVLREDASGTVDPATLRNENVALDIYGVRYIGVMDGPVAQAISRQGPLMPPRWEVFGREKGATYYRNTRALALGWLCPSWRDTTQPDALNDIRNAALRKFDPRREALVSGLASGGDPDASGGSAEVRWDGASIVRADVDSIAGGFLVFSINYSKGWTATVDGAPQAVYNTDYALAGLPVAAGRHQVVLSYHVPAWKWAAPWAGALAGLAGMMWVAWLQSPSEDRRAA